MRVAVPGTPSLLTAAFFLIVVSALLAGPTAPATPTAQSGGGSNIVLGPTCVTSDCHAGYDEGKFVHGPAAVGTCTACHEQTAGDQTHAFRMKLDGPNLCYFCHDEIEAQTHAHGPFDAGMCSACHDPHTADHPYMLKDDPNGPLCYTCHEQADLAGGEFVHAPFLTGDCLQCHDPHSSPYPMLLDASGQDLCFTCHTETRDALMGLENWHQPVTQDCAVCHEPHSSAYPMNLKAAVPDLCWSCHEDVHTQVTGAEHVHGALTLDKQCLNCHDPHASNHAMVLKASPIDTCLSCHDREIEVPGQERPLRDMKALLEENEFHHGPIEQGDCSACHIPHAGDKFRLLTEDYPAKFYAPFDLGLYALCFKCHDNELVTLEATAELTGFRDGKRNLHYLHVNQEKKGRTCRACHNVHASRFPFHIEEGVPFGGWEIPIKYEQLPQGGRCSPGCHQTKEYSRGLDSER